MAARSVSHISTRNIFDTVFGIARKSADITTVQLA